MKKQFTHQSFISYNEIVKINIGLNVIKHFIEVNFKLLPIYLTLNIKDKKTNEDIENLFKIDCLFSSFNFDVNTSKDYINSSILELIQNAFKHIHDDESKNNTKNIALNEFVSEYFKLKDKWNWILSN